MIDKTLEFLVTELNTFLGGRFPNSHHEQHVILASLSNPDGTVPLRIDNKIVVSLVNIEREPTASTGGNTTRTDNAYARTAPALHLNLYVLVAASFGANYQQALNFLSSVLGFFQGKQVFTAQSSATLPRELEKLSVELVNMSLAEMNNLWAILGAKYMPSAIYKVRMLSIQQAWMIEPIAAVSAAGSKVGT